MLTIRLTEETELEDDVVFYLVFTGSAVQHCTSTRKINHGTLETIAPGHDCCETVKVALCAAKEGLPVLVVAEGSFQFIQDEAYDAAQFLATCAGNQQALNFTRFLDRSRPPSGDVDFLDEKVVLAFRHLKLPAEWNVLGKDQTLNANLLHQYSLVWGSATFQEWCAESSFIHSNLWFHVPVINVNVFRDLFLQVYNI
uniref:Uncharacterized protein n=1 Tax=Chelonoidis abingdonii TaxID=106734 RepID=A0A8C0J7B9_CHEAB